MDGGTWVTPSTGKGFLRGWHCRLLAGTVPFSCPLSLPASSQIPTKGDRAFSRFRVGGGAERVLGGVRCGPALSLHRFAGVLKNSRFLCSALTPSARLGLARGPFQSMSQVPFPSYGGSRAGEPTPGPGAVKVHPARPGRPLAFLSGPLHSSPGIPASPRRSC